VRIFDCKRFILPPPREYPASVAFPWRSSYACPFFYVSGDKKAGKKVAVRIDQTLTQDATGTMAYLQFEAMGHRGRDTHPPGGQAPPAETYVKG